jgi:L-iditol 2-dehydrogenase
MCLQGMTHLCLHKRAFGVLDTNGSMAEFICVPEKAAIRIKEDTDFAIAAMVEPLAVALRGVHHGGDLRGKNVLIVGAGTIGLFVLILAKMQQPAQIIIADLNEHRLDVARRMGADITVRSDLQDTATVVKGLTENLGVDVAFECVGITPTTQQTISALKFGGLAVWIGNSAKMVETNMQAIVTRELMVHGSFLYALDEFREVIKLLEEKIIDIRPVISREITFEQAADMFHTLYRSPGDLIKVIIRQ